MVGGGLDDWHNLKLEGVFKLEHGTSAPIGDFGWFAKAFVKAV